MPLKRHVAAWLQRLPPLHWGIALGVKLLTPRHHVGAIGAVFNSQGQVLLVEHVFRPHYPWGLPGGWVERAEDPVETVRRELIEELGLRVQVKRLLFCQPQGVEPGSGLPAGLSLVYYCRPVVEDETIAFDAGAAVKAYEVLSTIWIKPADIQWELTRLDRRGITLGYEEFLQEQERCSR
jgi:8-oxo-dGTP pyrophosphatase MutT (NUDIX family)